MKLYLLALLLAFASFSVAQTTAPETLTNAKIISMTKAGLPTSVILKSIETKPEIFNLSTDAMIALKKQGVSDDVIAAMMGKVAPINGKSNQQPSKLVAGKFELLNQPYYFDNTTKTYKPFDKVTATLKSRLKVFGYGGSETNYEIEGTTSTIMFGKSQFPEIFINAGDGQSLVLALYKAVVKKNRRLAAVTSSTTFGKTGTAGSGISLNTSVVKNGLFKIQPGTELEAGEYIFIGKSATGIAYDAYPFTVQ